jgi:DNA-binding CsgD family transcriptional regulator
MLSWYALVEQVYDLADALATPQAAAKQSAAWTPVLDSAARYFGFDELVHCQGRPPSSLEPAQMVFVLPRTRSLAQPLFGSASDGLTEVSPFERQEHYLRARRGPHAPPPSALRPLVQRFLRHVARCMQVREGLVADRQSLSALYETLDRRELAIVLCDAQCRPVFVNRAATGLRGRHAELQFEVHASCWLGTRQPLKALFERFRRNVRLGRGGVLRLCTDSLLFTLVPLRFPDTQAAFAVGGPCLGLLIQERTLHDERPTEAAGDGLPEVPDDLRRRLRSRFALTEAEVRLCYGLYCGLSVKRYAALAERSPLTVRTQLKSVYDKTGLRDQKALLLRLWEEQQAEWVHCISWMAHPDVPGDPSLALLYPRLGRRRDVAPSQALLDSAASARGDDRARG